MKSAICIGVSIFLCINLQAVSQDLPEFQTVNLIGFWHTDSVAQLGTNTKRLAHTDSPVNKAISDDMDRAVISREYCFFDNGMFTAQWLLGTKPTVVNGSWGSLSEDTIFIEVDGSRTAYSVNVHGKEGIVIVPLRERRGEVHELYFLKQQEK